jgi:rpsU-divergently transcribed protein
VQLLRAALPHVPAYGWTQDAVAAAVASNARLSVAATGLVQAPYDLIAFCMDDWNDQLRQILLERVNNHADEWSQLSLVDRLQFAFSTRLKLQQEFLQANRWHEAMAVGARPEYVVTTSEKLQTMVETVCSLCHEDDNTASLNALEQFSLGAIYVAAELHLMSNNDTMTRFEDDETWNFLRQQLIHWDRLRNTTVTALPESTATVAYVSSTLVSSLTSGLASLMFPSGMPRK